jgi:UDP-glucose 4-epimerase
VLETIERALDVKLNVKFTEARTVDVPVNYLNISRYENAFGKLDLIPLEEGIRKTAEFMRRQGTFSRAQNAWV